MQPQWNKSAISAFANFDVIVLKEETSAVTPALPRILLEREQDSQETGEEIKMFQQDLRRGLPQADPRVGITIIHPPAPVAWR